MYMWIALYNCLLIKTSDNANSSVTVQNKSQRKKCELSYFDRGMIFGAKQVVWVSHKLLTSWYFHKQPPLEDTYSTDQLWYWSGPKHSVSAAWPGLMLRDTSPWRHPVSPVIIHSLRVSEVFEVGIKVVIKMACTNPVSTRRRENACLKMSEYRLTEKATHTCSLWTIVPSVNNTTHYHINDELPRLYHTAVSLYPHWLCNKQAQNTSFSNQAVEVFEWCNGAFDERKEYSDTSKMNRKSYWIFAEELYDTIMQMLSDEGIVCLSTDNDRAPSLAERQ